MSTRDQAQVEAIKHVEPNDDYRTYEYDAERPSVGSKVLTGITKVAVFIVCLIVIVAIKVGIRMAFR